MFSQYTVPDQSTNQAQPVLSPKPVHSDPQCWRQQFALTFIDSKQGVRRLSAENAAKHRQAIFSETERQWMSNRVVKSVPGHDPTRALLKLERFDHCSDVTAPFSFFHGPFGVSRLIDADVPDLEIGGSPPSPRDWLAELDEIVGQGEEGNVLTNLFDASNDLPVDMDDSWLLDTISSTIEPIQEAPDSPQLQIPAVSSLFTDNHEAWALLSHYKDRIVHLISPMGHGKEGAWLGLVMPYAVNTLGELTMSGSANHARLTLVNALLSTSAFHLGQHSDMHLDYWVREGNSYLRKAQSHFVQCMEENRGSFTKKNKYKEILMAILSLSIAYMVNGDSDKRRSCLLQAERFITINGFAKSTISQKRRSLHHCYAYMRIMAETTCIADEFSERLANTSLSPADDAPDAEFRMSSDIALSEKILVEEKDPNVAQRDLHLAIPGRWSLTLFPEMYGVEESFLMLLSQVIRLANERDFSILYQSASRSLNLRDFWLCAKALEKGINVLLSSCTSEHARNYGNVSEVQADNPRARAMYTALRIFFHRRIYDLDATMLQREVASVRSFLMHIQHDAAGRSSDSMATLIWPAFIAACEAVDSDSQAFFSQWFNTCSTTTGLVNASVAKTIIEMIWAKRQDIGLSTDMCTWPEVLRAKKIRLMCT